MVLSYLLDLMVRNILSCIHVGVPEASCILFHLAAFILAFRSAITYSHPVEGMRAYGNFAMAYHDCSYIALLKAE